MGDAFDQAWDASSAPPTGLTFDAAWDRAATPHVQPETGVSLLDRVMGGLKGVAKAGSDVLTAPADLLYRGGNAAIDLVTGSDTDISGGYPSDYRDSFVDFISGGEGDKAAEDATRLLGNLGTVIAAPSQAKNIANNIPLISRVAGSGGTGSGLANLLAKTLGYGAEGAGYSALFNAKSEDLGDDMAEGAALNIAIPATFKAVGGLAKGLSNTFSEGARKLELSAYGGMKGNIAKAYEKSPEILDEMGKRENPINLAINAFKRDGGGKKSMEGQDLLDELGTQAGRYAKELGEELFNATSKQTNAIVPQFTFTQNYVDKLAGAAKADGQAIADDLIAKTINNTDGTLLSLQAEKTALTPLIKDSAYGNNANPLKTEILKRIKGDLRRTIEEGYESVTGKSGSRIKNLNNELAHRENLGPLFENLRNSSEARDVLRSGIKSISTTGGVGQTAAAAMIAGGAGGLPLAIPVVLGNMYLHTPQGKRALANGLRSSLVQAPMKGIAQGTTIADPLGRAAASMGGNDAQADQEFSQLSRLLSSTTKQTKALESESIPLFKPTSGSSSNQYSFMNTLFKGDPMDLKPAQVIEEIKKDPVDHAIMLMESNGDPKAKNPDSSASGLFQLIKSTAKNLGVKDVFDPAQNYAGYQKLKQETIDRFGTDDVETIYASHYLGAPVLQKLLDGDPLTETQQAQVKYLQTTLLPKLRKIYSKLTKDSTGVVSA